MLTNAQIAVLCDIDQSVGFSEDKRNELSRLVAEGYAEKDGNSFKLTPKGETTLVDRGVGLNEA